MNEREFFDVSEVINAIRGGEETIATIYSKLMNSNTLHKRLNLQSERKICDVFCQWLLPDDDKKMD